MDEAKNQLAETLKNARVVSIAEEPQRIERIAEDSLDYFMLMAARKRGWGKKRIEEMRREGRDVSIFERTLSEFEDLNFPWEARAGFAPLPRLSALGESVDISATAGGQSKILTHPSKNLTTQSKNLTQELKGNHKEERKNKKKEATDALLANVGKSEEQRSAELCSALSEIFCSKSEKGTKEAAGNTEGGAKTGEIRAFTEKTGKLSDRGKNAAKNGNFSENGGNTVFFPKTALLSAATERVVSAGGNGAEIPLSAGGLIGAAGTFTERGATKHVEFGKLDAVMPIDADTTAPLPVQFMLRKLLWGKRVAVVGNRTPERDFSAEIDSCDVVIRFNNFYNYESGRVGKRVDVLFITPSSAWLNLKDDKARKIDIIQAQKPIVAFTRFKERAQWKVFQRVFAGLPYYYDANTNASNNQFTTGVSVLELIAQSCENCEVKVFGFGETDAEMWAYFEKDGRHYISGGYREAIVRERLLKILPRFTIYTDAPIEEVYPWEAQTDALGRKKDNANANANSNNENKGNEKGNGDEN